MPSRLCRDRGNGKTKAAGGAARRSLAHSAVPGGAWDRDDALLGFENLNLRLADDLGDWQEAAIGGLALQA